jgi:hypothetical protein
MILRSAAENECWEHTIFRTIPVVILLSIWHSWQKR